MKILPVFKSNLKFFQILRENFGAQSHKSANLERFSRKIDANLQFLKNFMNFERVFYLKHQF